MAYQFKYDSIHGKYDGIVEVEGDNLIIDGQVGAESHRRSGAHGDHSCCCPLKMYK